MGIDANGSRFLLFARSLDVSFARTIMVGRQGLHVKPETLASVLGSFGLGVPREMVKAWYSESSGYAEPLLKLLGAEEVRSLDVSDFEGATDIADLNLPVPENLRRQFTAVIESGTIEHVFNAPEAIRTCLELVAPGGHLLVVTPANNFFGHGFYQFGPDLWFRVLCADNGFRILKLVVFESQPNAPWYEVVDPAAIEERVTLVNSMPTYLAAVARRVSDVVPFSRVPYQSDYVVAWESHRRAQGESGRRLAGWKSLVPRPLKRLYRSLRRAAADSQYDPKYFRPLRVP